MKLSIVIPTYNQGPYIEDCLQSIQKQTFRDFEVIIQDSLSTDQTEEICNRYAKEDSRFLYFREKDEGQSDAINRGLARSKGQVWTWICSDDYYGDSHVLDRLILPLLQAKEKDPHVLGVFGDAQYVTETGMKMGPYYNETHDLKREDFKLNWPLSQPSSFLFRDVVDQVGGVDKSLYLGMDLDLFLKVLKEDSRLIYVPHLAVNIRIQPNSKSVMFRKKTAENALMIVRKHFGDFGRLRESAYFREYRLSQKLAMMDTIWGCIPFGRILRKSLEKLRHTAIRYMDPHLEERSVGIYIFRGFWGTYRLFKAIFISPVKSRLGPLVECFFRVKGHFTK